MYVLVATDKLSSQRITRQLRGIDKSLLMRFNHMNNKLKYNNSPMIF
jgi:hypothetical protein